MILIKMLGEGIICFEAENGKDYPYALRHDLIDQIKSLKKNSPIMNHSKRQI